MSFRPTLVVLIVAMTGAVAAALTWRGERSPAAAAAEAGTLATSAELPVDGVTRVTVERRGMAAGDSVVFERRGETWMQTAPFAHRMDPFSIRQFAVGGLSAEVVGRLEAGDAGASAKELGLDPPRAVVALEWPNGSATWQFGRRGVAGRWYARRAGDPTILMCSGNLYDRAVEMSPAEWRDRRLFPETGPSASEADEIVIAEGERRTVLRRDRRTWRLTEPVATRLDRRAREEVFRVLAGAQSGGFIVDEPADPARFGLEPPAGSVTIRSARVSEANGEIRRDPVVERLIVGGPTGPGAQDRFGMVEGIPVVVRLPEAALRALFRNVESLIDPTATWVEAPDVASLAIRGADWDLRLERNLESWEAPRLGARAAADRVEGLLAALSTVRAERVELRPYPRELEVAIIILQDLGGRPLDTIRVIRDPSTGRLCLENGDDVLRVMPESFTIPLTPAELGLSPGSAG